MFFWIKQSCNNSLLEKNTCSINTNFVSYEAHNSLTLFQMKDIKLELMKESAVEETNPLPEAKESTCNPGSLCATKVGGMFKYY